MRERPVLQFRPIEVGQTLRFDARTITALPAEHGVPAVGYHLDSCEGSLVFTGDTTVNEAFWPTLNRIANLRYLIIETAFSDRERSLALASKHLCPSLLNEELGRMTGDAEIYISHLKPGQIEQIMREIDDNAGALGPRMLQGDQIFEF